MNSHRVMGRIAVFTGGAAIVAMGALTSCSSGAEKEKEKEKETPSTSQTSPASSATTPTPTEKAVGGPDYQDSFTPTINPVPPGSVCKEIHNGVCVR